MPQRTAIYCRVSTADQSCERQEFELRAFAAHSGFEIVGVWHEVGSGSKVLPQRNKLLQLAQRGGIDQILVTEMTRWSRSLIDLIHTLNNLESWRCSIIAPKGIQLNLSTPEGRLFAALLGGIAEFERDLIRERVISGLEAAKRKGKKLGRAAGPPGSRISPRKVSQVLKERQHGLTYREIAAKLKLNVKTVMRIINAAKSSND